MRFAALVIALIAAVHSFQRLEDIQFGGARIPNQSPQDRINRNMRNTEIDNSKRPRSFRKRLERSFVDLDDQVRHPDFLDDVWNDYRNDPKPYKNINLKPGKLDLDKIDMTQASLAEQYADPYIKRNEYRVIMRAVEQAVRQLAPKDLKKVPVFKKVAKKLSKILQNEL